MNNNYSAFYSLLRAGLWEEDVCLSTYNGIDYFDVYRIAEEQSVVGLIAAGIEHVRDIKISQEVALTVVGDTLQLERTNKALNAFIGALIDRLCKEDIYALLVKGQGIAQCYERPLWRASGDVDLYLNEDDFQKAKKLLRPLVDSFDPDNDYAKHINMHYMEWVVEIHANQHCSLSSRINRVMDDIHHHLFYKGCVRSWLINNTHVFLPSPDNDVLIVFTHFLSHFYKGGVGLRQICDWCRLLWTYRTELDLRLLESRLRKAGLMSEWKAFAALAVDYLGMPVEAMPLYDNSNKWSLKAQKINCFILQVGNFGHNRDTSYYEKYPFLIRKIYSFSRRIGDLFRHSTIFPGDSLRFCWGLTISGLRHVVHGE